MVETMPSLFRFLFTLAVLAGIAYGAMFALVIYVEPREREISIRVPTDDIELKRITPDNSGAPVTAPDAEQAPATEQ